jgi:hypothetical protein
MVTNLFTPEMQSLGNALTVALDEAGLDIRAAFWLYLPDQNSWRYVFATPLALTRGPKRIYQKVRSILSHRKDVLKGINLSGISVVPPDVTLIALLRRAIQTGRGISGIRFPRNTIDGHFIEDAYIYRII